MKHISVSLLKVAATAALTLLGYSTAHPQDLGAVKLRLEHVNDFAFGYDRNSNSYTASYIKAFITEPVTRPVKANVCKSLPSQKFRMAALQDGKKCSTRTERVAPDAVALVWTLRGPHPVLNRPRDIIQVRKDLKRVSSLAADGCRPLAPTSALFVPLDACEVLFDVPISGSAANEIGTPYTIRFDAVDSRGKVLQTRSQEFAVPRQVPLIVSVGESLAAGQGNPDVPGKSEDDNWDPKDVFLVGQRDCEDDTAVMIKLGKKPKMRKDPIWVQPEDYRSLRSGPALAAQGLLDKWPYINFITLAKSGSKISSDQQKRDILDQLQLVSELVGTSRIDALLISAGGNDVGFGDGLRTMATDFLNSGADKVLSKFVDSIPKLRNEGYPSIAEKIKKLNVGAVLINEYPAGLFNSRAGSPEKGCGVFDNLKFWKVSKGDAVAVSRMGVLLNEEVKLAASRFGWRLVTGPSRNFQRHGYCTGAESFFRSAEDSCDMQGDFEGMMHPNKRGTAIYAEALERELRKVLPSPGAPTVKR